jgi:N-acetylglucosaminyl-diphospho-decaprenol L-rhamnosyltransferase
LSNPQHDLDVVVVSYESRDFLMRCLDAWSETAVDPLVVDNASTDGSAEAARAAGADVVGLAENIGFGAAANAGIERGARPFVLVTNADAWPRAASDVDALVARAAGDEQIAAAGPKLVGIDDSPQPTLLPVASRWWLGRPAVTSFPTGAAAMRRTIGPRRRPTYLVGAAILFRRAALEQVGSFDPSFFLFNEEVDLCLRLRAAGRLAVVAESTFVHVGGVATRPRWQAAYREQVRGHLRLLDKHEGRRAAEQARRWLAATLAAQAALTSGERRRFRRECSLWLRHSSVPQLLEEKPGVRKDAGLRYGS